MGSNGSAQRGGQETCNDYIGHADHGPRRELPRFADLSSQARSAAMDATIERVGQLSASHNVMAATIKAQGERIDAIERVTAARWSLPFLARLRWLLIGR